MASPYSHRDVLRAAISGVTTVTAIVAAPGANNRIVVLGVVLALSAAGTAQFHSAANALTGAMNLAAGTPLRDADEHGCLRCNVNEALNLTCVTGTGNGYVRYVVVPVS